MKNEVQLLSWEVAKWAFEHNSVTAPVPNHSAIQPLKEEKQIATKEWCRLGGEQEPEERELRMLARPGGLVAPIFWARAPQQSAWQEI